MENEGRVLKGRAKRIRLEKKRNDGKKVKSII